MIKTIFRLFNMDHSSKNAIALLNQHKKLIHQGLHTSAEVLSVSMDEDKIGTLFLVNLHIKLKSEDQKYEYIQTQALIPLHELPIHGKMVHIQYFPDNLKLVLLK